MPCPCAADRPLIHLTLIIVDFLTGLIMAGLWALLAAGGAIAAALGAGIFGFTAWRRWRGRR
ncbi:hypothetical protein [Sphingobium arseniciresistens]|uniref:hypothetical protein n=1 Tax=Sphingobium arseniciresistens TaxID=3030834 RepID=UPI0023B946D2